MPEHFPFPNACFSAEDLKSEAYTGYAEALRKKEAQGNPHEMPDNDKATARECENAFDDLLNEAVRKTAPHVISVSFEGIKAEVLLHALEEKNIYVSSGSSCSSNHPGISSTLKAIGVKKNLLDSTLRFSLSVNNTEEEIDYCIEMLKNLVPIYNRFSRK